MRASRSFALLVLLLASCARTPTAMDDRDDCPPPAAPADWVRDSGAAFTFALPPGHERVEVRGIDSEVGQFIGNGDARQTLIYDYGMYGGIPGEPEPGETRCAIERDDLDGIVYTRVAGDSVWYYGAWWHSDAWPYDVDYPLVLSGSVAAGDSAALREGLIAVGSVAARRGARD